MSKRYPAPWRAYPHAVLGEGFGIRDAHNVRVVGHLEEEEARLIVRACNSHEELLAAAKAALYLMETSEASTTLENDTYADLKTAVARAEGGES